MSSAQWASTATSPRRPDVAGLLLAAGGGRRLGGPKALVELGGERLVDRGVRLLRTGGCDPVVAVGGASAEQAHPRAEDVEVVVNPHWASGLASSLRAGLDLLDTVADAAVIALVDQPFVTAAAVRRVVAAWRAGAMAVVASYEGAPGHPVLLDRSLWPAVKERATGDAGARVVLREQPWLVTSVPCEDVADPIDVDRPEDLAAAQDLRPRSPRCS